MKPNFKGIAEAVRTYVDDHRSEILTGVGIAGMITTTVLAVQATPKALRLIEEKKQEAEKEQLTVVDTVKTTWKCYVPAVVTGSLSVACLVGASSLNAKRQAALMTAYKLSETALADYKEAVVETIGEKKEHAVREKVAEKQIEKASFDEKDIIVTGYGTTLCLDPLTGRVFYSDIEHIRKVVNEMNRRLNIECYISLNEFYEGIGLDTCDLGEWLGWNSDDGLLEMDFYARLTKNDKPCLVVEFNIMPRYEYHKMCK